jgi:hypothetical protein
MGAPDLASVRSLRVFPASQKVWKVRKPQTGDSASDLNGEAIEWTKVPAGFDPYRVDDILGHAAIREASE